MDVGAFVCGKGRGALARRYLSRKRRVGSEGGGREEGERGVRGGEKVGLDVEVKRER